MIFARVLLLASLTLLPEYENDGVAVVSLTREVSPRLSVMVAPLVTMLLLYVHHVESPVKEKLLPTHPLVVSENVRRMPSIFPLEFTSRVLEEILTGGALSMSERGVTVFQAILFELSFQLPLLAKESVIPPVEVFATVGSARVSMAELPETDALATDTPARGELIVQELVLVLADRFSLA